MAIGILLRSGYVSTYCYLTFHHSDCFNCRGWRAFLGQVDLIACKCLFEALLSIRFVNGETKGVCCLTVVFAERIIKLIACTPRLTFSFKLNHEPLNYSILTSVFLKSVDCFFKTRI